MVGKLLVWLAAAVGIAAFFLPFMSMSEGGKSLSFSAYQILVVTDAASDMAEAEMDKAAGEGGEMGKVAVAAGKSKLAEFKKQIATFLIVVWSPTALFLLLGLFGIKRFGRGLGIVALIVGLLAVAGWFLMNMAFDDPGMKAAGGGTGIGFTLLLLGAVCGFAGGLFGIIKPQEKPQAAAG